MTKFKVTYKIVQTREFNVPDVSYITSILSETNQCEIINIDKVIDNNSDINGDVNDSN